MTTEPLTPDAVRALIAEAENHANLAEVYGQDLMPKMIRRLAAALEASLPREDADLDAIEARADAAAGGEVVVQETEEGGWMLTHPAFDEWEVVTRTVEDAEFIAHAREDVPALIARVRRAEAAFAEAIEERDAMRAVHAEVRDIVQSLAVDGRMDDFAYDEITCPLDGDEWTDDDGNSVSSVWLREHDERVRAEAVLAASRTGETAEE